MVKRSSKGAINCCRHLGREAEQRLSSPVRPCNPCWGRTMHCYKLASLAQGMSAASFSIVMQAMLLMLHWLGSEASCMTVHIWQK